MRRVWQTWSVSDPRTLSKMQIAPLRFNAILALKYSMMIINGILAVSLPSYSRRNAMSWFMDLIAIDIENARLPVPAIGSMRMAQKSSLRSHQKLHWIVRKDTLILISWVAFSFQIPSRWLKPWKLSWEYNTLKWELQMRGFAAVPLGVGIALIFIVSDTAINIDV